MQVQAGTSPQGWGLENLPNSMDLHHCRYLHISKGAPGWSHVLTGVCIISGAPLLADNKGLLFVETSALDSTNVEEAFETILKGMGTGAVVQRGPRASQGPFPGTQGWADDA